MIRPRFPIGAGPLAAAQPPKRPWVFDERGDDSELERLISRVLEVLGEDPARSDLHETPHRVAKALRRLTSGYLDRPSDEVGTAVLNETYASLIVVKDIEVFSLCEHDLMPFHGTAQVGYIPNGSILGISDLARLVDVFARRLQVQERLTDQIADALVAAIQPNGAAVMVEARHLCTMIRGVNGKNPTIITSALRGVFARSSEQRDEFFRLVS